MLGLDSRAAEVVLLPANHTPETLAMAGDELVQSGISLYLGHGRRIPARFIHPATARWIYNQTRHKTLNDVLDIVKRIPGSASLRTLLRATHHNLWARGLL